jgi:hypothetical protein
MRHQGAVALSRYLHVRNVLLCPIVHLEFSPLARGFPIAFLRREGLIEAVALLGLVSGYTAVTAEPEIQSRLAPLLIKAFPLAAGPADNEGHVSIMVHMLPQGVTMADQPAFAEGGNLSAPFIEKSDCLWLFAASLAATRDVLADLDRSGAFIAWPLTLRFESGEAAPVGELMTIAPAFTDSDSYRRLIQQHGPVVATIVESQLLSRSNIQTLADFASDGRYREPVA